MPSTDSKSLSYHENLKNRNILKLRELLKKLPPFCAEYLITTTHPFYSSNIFDKIKINGYKFINNFLPNCIINYRYERNYQITGKNNQII